MLEGPMVEGWTRDGGRPSLQDLRDQALVATDLAFSLTDPHRDDNPLIWVNPAFTRVTGYPAAEAVGRNARFLQGESTDPVAVDKVRFAVANRQAVAVTLLNHRKDGTPFWNHLSISPVFDDEGEIVSFVGVQEDVTEQVRIDTEHERALWAERTARAETERARARLSALVDATTQLAATLDLDEALDRLATLSVPRLADWVVINLVDTHGKIVRTTVRHRDGRDELIGRFVEIQPRSLNERSGVQRLLAGGQPILIGEASPTGVSGHFTDPEMVTVVEGLGLGSIMWVPLVSRLNRIVGTMILAATPAGRRFNHEDLEAAADLGRRAGLAIDNARLYEHEHRAAVTLQRSLLPQLPNVPGITVAARYLPGEATADVGGDFYDILPLPDGSIGFAIGDVVGHDMSAAAAMGHLRGLLRACAWDDATSSAGGDAGRVLNRVDSLVQGLDVVPLATLFYGRLTLPGAGSSPDTPGAPAGAVGGAPAGAVAGARAGAVGGAHAGTAGAPGTEGRMAHFHYANAGHPGPLLRLPSGEVRRLSAGAGVLLGVTDLGPHATASLPIPVGSMLVGYTDGLVERRGIDVEEGIEALAATLAAIPAGVEPEGVAGHLLATVGSDRDDDVAVLVLRVDETPLTPAA